MVDGQRVANYARRIRYSSLSRHLLTVALPAIWRWVICPSTSNNCIFSSFWSKSDSQLYKYCSLRDQLAQMSATRSSFDQYCILFCFVLLLFTVFICMYVFFLFFVTTSLVNKDLYISHKTISQGAAAAPGPKGRREYPMTYFPALPILTTNPGDGTVC